MILSSIYNIIIGPIVLILEIFYGLLVLIIKNNHGFAVVGISFIVSLLCLPLYLKSEQLQDKERLIQKRLSDKISKIKKHFKKDEQYMLLSAYYKQNHYHPVMALRTSLGLLIQIPFFIAAYHFLSNFEPLRGEPFFFIRNLGAPDSLYKIGNFSINILPILMTIINIVSGIIYSKGFALKEKIQIYGMSVLFLVLLYNSPAALVLYWTCNNIFSLLKNIILKLKNSALVFYLIIASLLVISCFYVIFFRRTGASNQFTFNLLAVCFSLFILSIPFAVKYLIKFLKPHFSFLKNHVSDLNKVFTLSCISFGILCAVFIPFNIVASDPAEFSYILKSSPFNVLIPPLFITLGLLCFWPLYIYRLGNLIFKSIFSFFMSFILIFGIVNTFVFSGNYGMISQTLRFPQSTNFLISNNHLIFNILFLFLIVSLLFLIFRFGKLKIISVTFSVILISISLFSFIKTIEINKGFNNYKLIVESNQQNQSAVSQNNIYEQLPYEFTLSKDGHNIFILMLDKASGVFFNSIIEERSELKTAFNGFVYCPNTISYFRSTILGLPPILGGYEYTPENLHLRNNESMMIKNNEASLVLPQLFKDNGYCISVFDIPLINYVSKMDTTFFFERGMNANNLEEKFNDRFINELGPDAPLKALRTDLILKHNFTMFSIFLTSPCFLRKTIYDRGNFWAAVKYSRLDVVTGRPLSSYAIMHYLPELTGIDSSPNGEQSNKFIFMVSNLAHDPSFLQYPDYKVVSEITDFGPDLFNGNINSHQYYHVNAASYLLLAKWFDYLKENDVYDNTRIIIVSDHAEVLIDPKGTLDREYTEYNPILLYKDFNSTGELKINYNFMTNADVPMLATAGIIDNPTNPFTGNPLTSDKENGANIYLGGSSQPQDFPGWEALGRTSSFYHVKDNIFNENNWQKITKRF